MGIKVRPLDIDGVMLITPPKFGDQRGFFSEVYNKEAFAAAGIDMGFVQDNHSLSTTKGTVRGLHFQTPPFAQNKLVRVARGAIFDVAVDLRRGSPSYGKHVSAVVSAEAWNQILVPIGFAHGYMTLEPDTEVIYKVSNYYSPEHEKGLIWNDPDLAIAWPAPAGKSTMVDRDRHWPRLKDLPDYFAAESIPALTRETVR
jgi:dTDP-4-dehydrorhamnose 3,5-epimerase